MKKTVTDISPDRVKAQLERILTSSEFRSGKRLGQFLNYVVEQSLNGQARSIKQYSVAVEAFGYGTDFDPQSNPIVRIEAKRLRRALDLYYLTHGIEDPIRIDIPKGSYVPVFLENHTALQAADSSQYLSPTAASTQVDASKPTIAVITFALSNPADEFAYLATGLTEEIIIALTQFPNFFVVGPLSRDVIHRQGLDTRRIGQEYGVRFVLEGTLRKNKELFRLTVRLADAVSGQQMWGQSLEFNLQNGSIIASEQELVWQVAATIADSYGIIPRTLTNESSTRRNDDPDTYDAVLRFYHYFRILDEESYVHARNALEQAVRDNPDHALALAMLTDLVATSYLFGYDDDKNNLDRAEAQGRKAVVLDPSCQSARYTMALIYFLKFQRTLFLGEVEQCHQLNPNNAGNLGGLSILVGMAGDWERAMEMMAKAMHLNPHHPAWYYLVPFMNDYCRGEYGRALIEAHKFSTPGLFWDPLIRAAVLGQLEHKSEAEKAVDELRKLVSDFNVRGPSLIRRLAYLDEHVDILVEGLRKAGMTEL